MTTRNSSDSDTDFDTEFENITQFFSDTHKQDNDCLKNDPECSTQGSRCYNVLTGRFHCECHDGFYGEKCESIRRRHMLKGRG